VVRLWRLLWQVAAGVVIAVGGWVELRRVDVWLSLMAIGMLWALAATMAWLLRPEFETAAVWVERFAPMVAIASLVLPGLLRLGAGVTVGIVVALAVTSPYLWRPALRRRPPRRVRRTSSAPVLTALDPLPPEDLEVPDALGPKDLAQAWQSSFVALQRTTSPTSRARIADARAACLDALERCDHAAFTAWLDQGPRPGSDPSPWFERRDEAG
jgi:hypothetical protein